MMAWLGYVCFALGSLSLAATDPLWESGLTQLTAGDAAGAAASFTTWIEKAETDGVRSTQAHHNAALAFAEREEWGPTVYHLVRSATLAWPWDLWRTSHALSRIQHHLLIQNAVSRHWRFRLAPFFRPGAVAFFAALAGWLFLFALLRRSRVVAGWGLIPLCLALAAAKGPEFFPTYAVVTGDKAGVALQSEASSLSEKKLVDLQAGTLVALAESAPGYRRVTAPFAGWIAEGSLQILRPY